MDSNLTALLREIVTAMGDHADAIRDLAEAVREHTDATAPDAKKETIDD